MLATVAIAFPLLTGTSLGVSGFLARVLRRGSPVTAGTNRCSPESDSPQSAIAMDGCGALPPLKGTDDAGRSEWLSSFLFLFGMLIGGGLAGWAGGQSWKAAQLSPEFYRLFGHGLSAVLVLFGGGILVGFGTRLSGGCTSGHGLSGCGRLQPASLVATAVFFGVAIGVSFLLERLRS